MNLIPFPPCFFIKILTSFCWPSSTHLLPLVLYHVIWRLPSSNLCWNSHHLPKIFWKTTTPFLTFNFCPKPLKKLFTTNFSPISYQAGHSTEIVLLLIVNDILFTREHFCSSFVGSFGSFWHYWPPNSPLRLVHYTSLRYSYKHSVNHQLFVDDAQLQKSTPLSEVTNLTKELDACTDKKTWMTENQLKLNDDKTEALHIPFSSSLKPSAISLPDLITLGSHNIPISDSARNLGVIFDSNLSTKKHVTKIC